MRTHLPLRLHQGMAAEVASLSDVQTGTKLALAVIVLYNINQHEEDDPRYRKSWRGIRQVVQNRSLLSLPTNRALPGTQKRQLGGTLQSGTAPQLMHAS
jgi:hypothetical protein